MKNENILKIKNRKRFLKSLAEAKKRNFEDNMKFATWYAYWLKRTSNREWSKQQRRIIDEVYKANRHLKLNPAK